MSDLCDFDLAPKEARDIERYIYIFAWSFENPDLINVAAYLMHKYWGLL